VTHRPRLAPRLGSLVLVAAAVAVPALARAEDAPNTGACIAASESAVALKKENKLIDARTQLSLCASPSCPDVVKTSCHQRLTEVGHAIATLVLVTKDTSGNDLTAVTLSIDGAPYASRLDGSAIELDPGEHELRLEVAGQPVVVRRLVMHEGERQRRETVVLGAPAVAAPGAEPARGSEPGVAAPPSNGGAERTIAEVVGGVGLAALAVGGIFGVLTMSAHNNYEQHCGAAIGAPAGSCDERGVVGESDATSKGTLSTIFFAGGAVAAAAAVILFVTAPKGTRGARVGVGPGGVIVGGRF